MGTEFLKANLGRALIVVGLLMVAGPLAVAQIRGTKPAPDPELPPAAPGDSVDRPATAPKTAPPRTNPSAAPARRPAAEDPMARRPAGEVPQREGDPEVRPAERRAGLGVQFDAQADALTVSQIEEDSIAAQAGLRTGDRIVAVDGQTMANQRQFQAYLSGQYGRRVPVIIERDGRQYTVQLGMRRPATDGAWLGVYLNDQEGDQPGALITQIYPAGPAARAGLRPGDVVLQMDGKPVAGTPELIAVVEMLEPRQSVEFFVRRGQNEITVPVTLGSRNSFVSYGEDEDFDDGGEQFAENDEFSRIPPYAMQLEHDRRMAEQHQRIEMELRKLQEEVRKLREALQPRN